MGEGDEATGIMLARGGVRLSGASLREAVRRTAYRASSSFGDAGGGFRVKTFNAIAPEGLAEFPVDSFDVSADEDRPHAILLRSHKLQLEEVPPSVRAIARCGAGTNNIPVEDLTKQGIPVFNTPGSNANAVNELVICSLFLASRGIVEGIQHMDKIFDEEAEPEVVKKRVESEEVLPRPRAERKDPRGRGLGNIGAAVAEAALALGMNVVGFDPKLSVDAAWRLPSEITPMDSLLDLAECSDYLTLHVPYIKDATHHIIGEREIAALKKGANLINFARGELVDSAALLARYETGDYAGKYIADFADPILRSHPKVILLPHLGASTEEAEINSAAMAVNSIKDYLRTGSIKNSVNFPTAELEPKPGNVACRVCIINENIPGMLGQITGILGSMKLNIVQQLNTSRGGIAYNVVDLGEMPDDPRELQLELAKVEGVLSSRMIVGLPGAFYYSAAMTDSAYNYYDA